jgi:nitroreductase
VLEAISKRRSIRRFTQEAISREELLAILEAGRMAPSGKNTQPCRFLPVYAGEPEQEALAKLTAYSKILRNAQLLLVVCLDNEATYDPVKDCQAAGAAMQNMLLAAHSLGIGGVWIGQIVAQEQAVLQTVGLSPEQYQLMAVLVFGRPDDPNAKMDRHPLSTFLLKSV